MTDNMREFVKFFILGLAKDGVKQEPEKEPIAYLYNGVKLPKLPEWDKESYPYAFIVGDNDPYINLYISPVPWTCNVLSVSKTRPTENCYVQIIPLTLDDTAWSENWTESWFTTSGGLTKPPVWSNFDVLSADGTLYLAATDPIPVYE